MALTIGWWTTDVDDAESLAPFYEQLLGWHRVYEDPAEGIALAPPGAPQFGGHGLLLYLEHGTGPKTSKNPAHPDLRPVDQAAAVDLALRLGAQRVDIGQGDVSWTVMTDPGGNELCILAADGTVDASTTPAGIALEAWVLDVADRDRAAAFWRDLLGWMPVDEDEAGVRLADPAGLAVPLDLYRVPDERRTKNRVHPDLVPSGERGDDAAQAREVERALDLGARRADIGQGETSWTVLVDPEGNEFCILSARGWDPQA
jgi:catechol 2,3-dioxygenase-like lactoylglutathione lyase family enzyme